MKIKDLLEIVSIDQYIEVADNENIYEYGYLTDLNLEDYMNREVFKFHAVYDLGLKFYIK